MAWRGTRMDVTWQARPRGSTMRTHASACVVRRWRGRVARPQESTQMLTERIDAVLNCTPIRVKIKVKFTNLMI